MRSIFLAGAAALSMIAMPGVLGAQTTGETGADTSAAQPGTGTTTEPSNPADPMQSDTHSPAPPSTGTGTSTGTSTDTGTGSDTGTGTMPPPSGPAGSTGQGSMGQPMDSGAQAGGSAMSSSSQPMVQGNMTVPPDAMNKTYPPCTRTLQDSCRNRGGR